MHSTMQSRILQYIDKYPSLILEIKTYTWLIFILILEKGCSHFQTVLQIYVFITLQFLLQFLLQLPLQFYHQCQSWMRNASGHVLGVFHFTTGFQVQWSASYKATPKRGHPYIRATFQITLGSTFIPFCPPHQRPPLL